MKATGFEIPTDWPLNPRDMTTTQLETISWAHDDELQGDYMCECGFCDEYMNRTAK